MNVYDLVVSRAALQTGRRADHAFLRGAIPLTNIAAEKRGSHDTSRWTAEEDEYLMQNLGWLTEQEIAKHLGRTVVAVHLRWKRDLNLTAPSKHPDWLTGHQAASMLGVDGHKIVHWCDFGLIPCRVMPGGRKIRLIYLTSFKRWVISTKNWIYFDWTKISDPSLKRLCALRAKRWGDEWWSSAKVGEFHRVDSKDVQRLVYRGELPAVQVETSLGGRHKDPAWLNWFILRSDAVKAHFVRGQGLQRFEFSKRALKWIKKAHKQGFSWAAINRSMGSKCADDTIKKAYFRMIKG